MADIYTKLGVERGADEAAIKKAYRKLAKELHPDRNRDNPKAAERFAEVTAAYDLLSDKDKRARYDRGEIDEQGNPKAPFGFGAGSGGFRPGGGQGHAGFGGEGGDFGDIFEGLFGGARGGRAGGGFGAGFGGGQRRPPPKGANVAYRLAVPFEEAAALKLQRVTLSDGKTIDIKLTPGVEDGTQMRLAGKGEAGPGGFGDAILTIEVRPHRFFTRDGDDVRLDLPIGLDEAVKGGAVPTPTVEGVVKLTVPRGSTSGKTLRLKGRGFHRKGRHAGRTSSYHSGSTSPPTMPSSPPSWKGGALAPRATRGGAWRLAPMQDVSPEAPEARAHRDTLRYRFDRGLEKVRPGSKAFEIVSASRSASIRTGSSTPAISPIWRC